jgi:hypothetical protein
MKKLNKLISSGFSHRDAFGKGSEFSVNPTQNAPKESFGKNTEPGTPV